MNRLSVAVAIVIALSACKKFAPKATAASESAAQGADLSGEYTIATGTNPGGGGPSYAGTVSIQKVDAIYKLNWTIKNTPPYDGVALTSGNILGVGWGVGGQYGVVVYKVSGGKLSGKWAHGDGSSGTEDLEGPASLDGTFTIARAVSSEGKPYTGTVTIKPTGATYAVTWNLTHESYSGVGIKENDTLTIGWGTGKGAGVVSYTRNGNALDGKWAIPGGTALGTENLTR